MKNTRIRKTSNNTYVVIADTKRFGNNAIMFESYLAKDCQRYCNENGLNLRTRRGVETKEIFCIYNMQEAKMIIKHYSDGHFTMNISVNGVMVGKRFARCYADMAGKYFEI